MRVNAYGSNHLDPEIQLKIDRLAEEETPLVVEGLPEKEQEQLNEASDIDLDFGFDISDEHRTEAEAADETGQDTIYLDKGRSLEEQVAVINEVAERLGTDSIQRHLKEGTIPTHSLY